MTNTLNKASLPKRIAGILSKEIRRGFKPGDKIETEPTLAARFDVSVVTIREAVGILIQLGLVERRHGSGTYVMDFHAAGHIAILTKLDVFHPRAPYFYRHASQTLVELFREQGYEARLYAGRVKPGEVLPGTVDAAFTESLEKHRIRGVVGLAAPTVSSWLKQVTDEGVPVVGETSDYPFQVVPDRDSLVRRGVQELAQSGRTRIALMAWRDATQTKKVQDVGRFREEMANQHLEVHENWIRDDLFPLRAAAGWTQMRAIWSASHEKPDGILICDDLLFRDASMAILEMGISVPRQLAVVTHANSGSDILYPFPATLLQSDVDAFAKAMSGALLDRLTGKPHSTQSPLVVPIQVLPASLPEDVLVAS